MNYRLLNYLRFIKNSIKGYSIPSYSQEGEDLILNRIFEGKKEGFFVDIGAHHPKRFSNTYLFYKKGWKGINIDATPGSMDLFKIFRSRDINIEVPVSDKNQTVSYYMFNDPALNGFSERKNEENIKNGTYYVVETKELTTKTLKNILDSNLPTNQKIDFMSIDVEGFDYNVLVSNDWNKYKPEVVVVEDTSFRVSDAKANRIYDLMESKGYQLIAKTCLTLFFRQKP